MRRRTLLSGISFAALGILPAAAQTPVPPAPVFNPQAPKGDDTVAQGFNRLTLASWGDPLLPNAPPFNPYPLTQDQAATQFPYDAVIAGLVAPQAGQDGASGLVLTLANPDVPARMVFPGGIDQPAVAGSLQGGTVLNLQYQDGRWEMADGGFQSRRLTDGTLCQISGPAAAAIGTSVQGLLSPHAGCATLWATALLAEGNPALWLRRLAGTDLGYSDPSVAPRFGWVTEINPLDPSSFPVKRTALGRFIRGGIAATLSADGRPVIFMTQDAPAGMLLRFIAATNATDGTALDSGTLSVAQIQGSQIKWIDLGGDVPSLVGTVNAAQAAGGSHFDAPGGLALATDGSGAMYLACRGNPQRGIDSVNALNPRAGDGNGHILAFHAPNGDFTAKNFAGEVAIAAGNPATAAFTQYAPGSGAWFTQPRTVSLDNAGQLWIGTNQGGAATDTADGLFIMQTGGASKYLLNFAYLAPIGASIGGAAFDLASRTIFAMVRHPGATPNASFNNPATRWPTLQPNLPPQSTLIGLVGV